MSRDIAGTWRMNAGSRRASFPTREEWEDRSDESDESEVSDLIRRPDDSAIRALIKPKNREPRLSDLLTTRLQSAESTSRTAAIGPDQTGRGQDQLPRGSLDQSDQQVAGQDQQPYGSGQDLSDRLTNNLPASKSNPDLIALVTSDSQQYPVAARHRQQLETLLERTEDDSLSNHQSPESENQSTNKWTLSSDGPESTRATRQVGCIAGALLAVAVTITSPILVAPLFSLASSWFCLNWFFLTRWQRTTPSLTVCTVSGYGLLGELTGYLTATLCSSPLHPLRSAVVLLCDAALLHFCLASPGFFKRRIFLLLIFLAVSRAVACSVIFLPGTCQVQLSR